MAIQDSINGAVGALAGAAVAGKHLSQQGEAAKAAKEQKELTSVYNYQMAQEHLNQIKGQMSNIESKDASIAAGLTQKEEQQAAADSYLKKWTKNHPGQQLAFSRFGSGDAIVKGGQELQVERARIKVQREAFAERLNELHGKENEQQLTLEYAEKQLPKDYKGGNK